MGLLLSLPMIYSANHVCIIALLKLTIMVIQRETRELVIQRLEQERAESEAANAGPVGVDDINTDDEVPCPGRTTVPQCCYTGAVQRTPCCLPMPASQPS